MALITTAEFKNAKNAALVGNMGLYAVCFELAKRGWNVMPTSRNARGVDIVAYDQKGKRTITVQVKALSKAVPVPLGSDPLMGNLIADFIIIARGVREEERKQARFFIARADDVRNRFSTEGGEKDGFHTGVSKKTGKKGCWLQRKGYEPFEDRWDVIGDGW